MTGISREDRLKSLVALDLLRQGPGPNLASAEIRAAQKVGDAAAHLDVAAFVDPWRRSPNGPVAEAEKFLQDLARRLGIDGTRGYDQVAASIEAAIQASVKIDASPGAWGQPLVKKWSLLDAVTEKWNALRGNKAALSNAFSNAIASAGQLLKDLDVLEKLEKKAAFNIPLTAEHRGQLLEIRDRFRADFTMAVEDPKKANRYVHNGVGEKRALEAIEIYARIQAVLGEPVSEAGLDVLRRQVFESVLGAAIQSVESVLAEKRIGGAQPAAYQLDHTIPDALAARAGLGIKVDAQILRRLAVLQNRSSPEYQALEQMQADSHVAFWKERGKAPPDHDRRTPAERSHEQLLTMLYVADPWELLAQVEARGGLEKMGQSPEQLKTALTNAITFLFELQSNSINSLVRLAAQSNPFRADEIEARLAKIDDALAIMKRFGITSAELESSKVMLLHKVDDILATFEKIRAGLPALRAGAALEAY